MDVRELLDPEISAALGTGASTAADFADLPAARAAALSRLLTSGPPPSASVERTDHVVPSVDGAPPVRVRLHRPVGAEGALGVLFFIHGGGYITGSLEMDDLRLGRIVDAVGCAAVAVEYRLAPECPYPAPLEDCWNALAWVVDHADELGVDPARVAVGGASAGGGLAAAVVHRARDRGGPAVVAQVLVYPMLDDREATPSSGWDATVWSRSANRFGWDAYLGAARDDAVTADMAPGRATDHGGLPPTFVAVGALDLFVDEDVAYATALLHAGVPVELHVYPGAPHGFWATAGVAAITDVMVHDLNAAVRRALAP